MVKRIIYKIKEMLFAHRVNSYWAEIEKRNCDNYRKFSVTGSILMIFVMILGLLLHKFIIFNTQFAILLSYLLLNVFFSYTLLKRLFKYIISIFYLAFTPIMIIGIIMGTFLDSNKLSITIMILLCVLPLFILDKPWRIFTYITLIAVTYAICCYYAKSQELFVIDIIDLITFYLLSIGLNMFILTERIDSVENYMLLCDESKIDHLTGIYNRGAGVEKVNELLHQGIKGAFIIMDIDDFKSVNDTYGHILGDKVLKVVSNEIKRFCGTNDIFFRMGGDEFAIFATSLLNEEKCRIELTKLIDNIKNKEISSSLKLKTSVSLGCSIFGIDDDISTIDLNKMYKTSDACLYRAKNSGRGCFCIQVCI